MRARAAGLRLRRRSPSYRRRDVELPVDLGVPGKAVAASAPQAQI